MKKLYLNTMIEDCACPTDFLHCTEKQAKRWAEDSSKAVIYFELFENEELFEYGCIHFEDLPTSVWKEYCHNGKTKEIVNFIKEIYPDYVIAL